MAPFIKDGLVTVDENEIAVSPRGKFLVRNVGMVFDRYLRDGARAQYSRAVYSLSSPRGGRVSAYLQALTAAVYDSTPSGCRDGIDSFCLATQSAKYVPPGLWPLVKSNVKLQRMSNTSIAYERLVKELHEALLHAEGVETIGVIHEAKIIGKSGVTHRVDVYWEFRLGGVKYKTCIECKHYSTRIKKSHIASFSAVLDDIGNATGIFATTVGFQKGALLFAESKGIRLILVNRILKTVFISSNFIVPTTAITAIRYNKAQVSKRLTELGIESYDARIYWDSYTSFYDERGDKTVTLSEFFKGKAARDGEYTLVKPGIYDLTEIGLLEVEEITYSVNIHRNNSTVEINVNSTERAIVEDVLDNSACYLNDDGSIAKISQDGIKGSADS